MVSPVCPQDAVECGGVKAGLRGRTDSGVEGVSAVVLPARLPPACFVLFGQGGSCYVLIVGGWCWQKLDIEMLGKVLDVAGPVAVVPTTGRLV